MSKKRVSGAWVDDTPHIYNTSTDTFSTFPHEVIGDGQSNLTWSMDGNMQVNGTPTPQNPITPAETGEKTANLFDKNGTVTYDSGVSLTILSTGVRVTTTTSGTNKYKGIILSNDLLGKTLTVSMTISVSGNNDSAVRLYYVNGRTPTDYITRLFGSTDIGQKQVTFTMPNVMPTGSDGIAILFSSNYSSDNGEIGDYADYIDIMINEGSTALPYEPYGYKIPILSNGNTYPVYLSEPIRKINTYADSLASSGTVTRAIKQVAFTGQEEWEHYGSSVFWTKVENNGVLVNGNGLSNSYIYNPTTSNVPTTIENGECGLTSSNGRVYIKNTNYANATAFKQYLANQYVAGTPVTVWYVLATATTETFTAPTLPTSGSPQTFDVDTTLKPSEVSLTYHGWHEHSDTKYTSG